MREKILIIIIAFIAFVLLFFLNTTKHFIGDIYKNENKNDLKKIGYDIEKIETNFKNDFYEDAKQKSGGRIIKIKESLFFGKEKRYLAVLYEESKASGLGRNYRRRVNMRVYDIKKYTFVKPSGFINNNDFMNFYSKNKKYITNEINWTANFINSFLVITICCCVGILSRPKKK